MPLTWLRDREAQDSSPAASVDPGSNARAAVRILDGVSAESAAAALADCPVRTLAPGEVLLRAGERNRTLFVLLEGQLCARLHVEDGEHTAGEHDAIFVVDPGETVGEMSVIDGRPVTASVTALSAARVLAMDEETFWRLIVASHEFATNLLVLLAGRIRSSDSTLRRAGSMRRQLERDAHVDGLTGLFNRRWLDARLPRVVERAARNGGPLSVLLLDVDHFKRFNDEFGHLAGDAVLASVAACILSNVRPTDMAARYGGEEIVVALPDTDVAGALAAAERVRSAIERLRVLDPDGRELPTVTVSCGVGCLAPGDSGRDVIEKADAQMYRAKASGRNRVCA